MTVCIAAICTWGTTEHIIVAVDRMITAGDIQYEPDSTWQPKIYALTTHALALAADQITPQTTICADTADAFTDDQRPNVRDVVDTYCNYYKEFRLKRNITQILSPLGLSMDDFHKRLGTRGDEKAEELEEEFYLRRLEADTIIAGIDVVGGEGDQAIGIGHLYTVSDPGDAHCQDAVGFSAIGAGKDHAESQFMLAGYTRKWSFPDALVLTYVAKKRAERAPGVGRETDLYMIGAPSGYSSLNDVQRLVKALEESYKDIEMREAEARKDAILKVGQEFKGWINESAEQTQQGQQAQKQGTAKDGAQAGQA